MSADQLDVFVVKEVHDAGVTRTVWSKAGRAFIGADKAIRVYLDVLPLDGKLLLREPKENPT